MRADLEGSHLSSLLEAFVGTLDTERIALGTISDFMGRRSIGALLFILASPMALPIPAPGISVLFGIPMMLIAGELLIGRRTAWLPARLASRSVARVELVGFIMKALPRLRVLERMIRPRVGWLAADWAMIPVGAVCLVLAIVIALPIPLGHMVPGSAICVMALGLMERDGLAIAFGLLLAAIGVTIVILASMGVASLLWGWISPN